MNDKIMINPDDMDKDELIDIIKKQSRELDKANRGIHVMGEVAKKFVNDIVDILGIPRGLPWKDVLKRVEEIALRANVQVMKGDYRSMKE